MTGICIKCYVHTKTINELLDCDLQICKDGIGNVLKCDSCLTSVASNGNMNICHSSAHVMNEVLSILQDMCIDVTPNLNKKLQNEQIKHIKSVQKLTSPEQQKQYDQMVEAVKNIQVFRVCTCSTDGCNHPVATKTTTSRTTRKWIPTIAQTNNAGERSKRRIIPILVAIFIIMIY